jgi:nicotinamide mononucleotide transporter
MEFILLLQKMPWWEVLGVGCSVLQVLFARKNHAINYLFGIIGVSITIYIFCRAALYAESLLNVYYLIMSFYGLYVWQCKTSNNKPIPISYTSQREKIIAAIIVIGVFLGLYLFLDNFTDILNIIIYNSLGIYVVLDNFTDSTVFVWDASVTAFAWAGMWLMAKRKIAYWVLLNISNLIAIPLQIYKGLYLYAALSAFLFIIATISYFEWKKIIKLTLPD